MNEKELKKLKDAFDLIGGLISEHEGIANEEELVACDMSDLDEMDRQGDEE